MKQFITIQIGFKILFTSVVCLILSSDIFAATIVSSGSGNWNSTGTWVGGAVPGSSDSAVILSNHTVTVTANQTVSSVTLTNGSTFSFTRLTINSSVTLIVSNYLKLESTAGAGDFAFNILGVVGTLDVNGDIIFSSPNADYATIDMRFSNSLLQLAGNITNDSQGKILTDANASTIELNGSSSQTVPSNANIQYKDLLISSSNTVTFDGNTTISNDLTISNGTSFSFNRLDINSGVTLTVSNDLTLESTGGATDFAFSILSVMGSLDVDGDIIFSSLNADYATIDMRFSNSLLQLAGNITNESQGKILTDANASTIELNGTSAQTAASNVNIQYKNLLITSSSIVTLSGNTDINGNLTLSSGTLDADNTNNYSINISGNFNNNATFEARAGTVTFDGTTNQSISSGDNDLYDIVINNTSTAGVTLSTNVVASNTLTLTDGIVSTGANILITSNTSATSLSGGSSASFVNGDLRRYFASNTDTYNFPVGDGTASSDYYLAELINGSLTGVTYITASFGTLSNHNDGDMSVQDTAIVYSSVNTEGVWYIDPNSQPSGGDYDIRLYTANFSGLEDDVFAILKRSSGSTTAADWAASGTLHGTQGRKVTDGYAYRMGFTSFSQFGGGEGTGADPLPIELMSFDAKLIENNNVEITWSTAVEINNEFFTLEKSDDGINYMIITTIKGAGNSTVQLNYKSVDDTPYNGVTYYRLKQTDYDGQFEYFNPVPVKAFNDVNILTSVSPNPTNNSTGININLPNEVDYRINIYNLITGQTVFNSHFMGGNWININTDFAPGNYIVKVDNGEKVEAHKIWVIR